MQFANQAISLFISGVFCLVWVGILALLFCESYVLEFMASVRNATNTNMYVVFFTFFIFPLAYAIGNGVNAVANKMFGGKDKKIRRDAFKTHLKPKKGDEIYKEICDYFDNSSSENSSKDASPKKLSKIKKLYYYFRYDLFCHSRPDHYGYLKLKNDSAKTGRLYHHFRYVLYHSGSDIYNYLIFHREIIRILRATRFNFALICFSFSLILIKLVIKHAIYYSSFIHHPLIYFSIVFSYFISRLCFCAWEKQQKDFYVTIILAWVALDMENKNKSQKLQAI